MLQWVGPEPASNLQKTWALAYKIKAEPSAGTPIMEGFFSPFSLASRSASSMVAPVPTTRSWSSEIATHVPGGSPASNFSLSTFTTGMHSV